jgi:hypothetical protein
MVEFNAALATDISAIASMIYAAVSCATLLLLSRQIRDARRFGAAPALYALLKELDEQLAAIRQLGNKDVEDAIVGETISRCLEFFERIEHLRRAGVLPTPILRRAFGNALAAVLADHRVAAVIQQDARQHGEVLLLAKRIGHR